MHLLGFTIQRQKHTLVRFDEENPSIILNFVKVSRGKSTYKGVLRGIPAQGVLGRTPHAREVFKYFYNSLQNSNFSANTKFLIILMKILRCTETSLNVSRNFLEYLVRNLFNLEYSICFGSRLSSSSSLDSLIKPQSKNQWNIVIF